MKHNLLLIPCLICSLGVLAQTSSDIDFSSMIGKEVIMYSPVETTMYTEEAFFKNSFKESTSVSISPWGRELVIKEYKFNDTKKKNRSISLLVEHEGKTYSLHFPLYNKSTGPYYRWKCDTNIVSNSIVDCTVSGNTNHHFYSEKSLRIACIETEYASRWADYFSHEYYYNVSRKSSLPFYCKLAYQGIMHDYYNGLFASFYDPILKNTYRLQLSDKTSQDVMPISVDEYQKLCRNKYGVNITDSLKKLFVGEEVYVQNGKHSCVSKRTCICDSIVFCKPKDDKDPLLEPCLVLRRKDEIKSDYFFPVNDALNYGVVLDSVYRKAESHYYHLQDSSYSAAYADYYNIANRVYGRAKAEKIMANEYSWGDDYEAVTLGHWWEMGMMTIHENVSTPIGRAKELRCRDSNVSYYFINNKLIGIKYQTDQPFWVPKTFNWKNLR